jgi:hypothetical protein
MNSPLYTGTTFQTGSNLYGTTTITGGQISTGVITTTAINTQLINQLYANDNLPNFNFGPYATSGTVQLTVPGQYFFNGITSGVVIDMFINADTSGVPTPSGASGTGNYVLTNRNTFNTSMNIYLQILYGSVAAYVGFQIGPNVSCTFTLVRSSLGNIVYQNLNTSVPYYPSGY